MSYANALREEEQNKEKIYSSFEREVEDLLKREKESEEYYDSGSYEDQDTFVAAGTMWGARKRRYVKEKLVKALYDKPYFAHIRMSIGKDGDCLDCFLSDNEQLEGALTILNEPNMYIIPFKQDKERPFSTAAFHCYQAKTDERIPISVKGGDIRGRSAYIYHPKLIRDVEVYRRQVGNIITFLPQESVDTQIEADELLAKKLDENRNDVKLRNIIATLQWQQFDIIRTDVGTSFIVQGCAGSGKTQCLIHRLFFLRDLFGDNGWDKVLLITPTQLFRNYSSELMRRYNLETIANISLAAFYKRLLESFDQRFSKRQYLFELTEEYLPDEYLRKVYSLEQIKKIDSEIDNAIYKYVSNGCKVLGEELPLASEIGINFINKLLDKLDDSINQIDKTKKPFSKDEEYISHERELKLLEKQLRSYQQKLDSYIIIGSKYKKEKNQFDDLLHEYMVAKMDVDEEINRDKKYIDGLSVELNQCIQGIKNHGGTKNFFLAISDYVNLHGRLLDRLEVRSDDLKFEVEYRALLNSSYKECEEALLKFTKGQSYKSWMKKYSKNLEVNKANIKGIIENIDIVNLYIEDQNAWIAEHRPSDTYNQNKAHREELESTYHFLSRIESLIFEREVWNALAPLKSECGIETTYIERLSNGRLKQSRILYKSDLMFYLKIYDKLHKIRQIPEYNLICIDEGQDLHSVDYDLIKSLYPKSVLNVFGDKEQVLNVECGINDWRAETGIEKLYEMNNNYRNNASIVEFCNRNFGSNMLYYGNISLDKAPEELLSANSIGKYILNDGIAVIVKNIQMFGELRATIKDKNILDRLFYIDTKAEKVPEEVIPCYSVFAAKGLEFNTVLVYAKEMTNNQKIVACTRAMEKLFYYE